MSETILKDYYGPMKSARGTWPLRAQDTNGRMTEAICLIICWA